MDVKQVEKTPVTCKTFLETLFMPQQQSDKCVPQSVLTRERASHWTGLPKNYGTEISKRLPCAGMAEARR